MHELVTADGWAFHAQSFVKVRGKYIDLDDLNERQKNYVAAMLNVNGLNAAYAGRALFQAEGLPSFDEVFPEPEDKDQHEHRPPPG